MTKRAVRRCGTRKSHCVQPWSPDLTPGKAPVKAWKWVFFGGKKRQRHLIEAGVNTQAVLVSFQEVGQQNFTPLVDLTLRITPTDGSAPFQVVARTQVQFSQIGNLKPGDIFSARYDPEDHGNWELGEKIASAPGAGAEQSLDSASAGQIAAAVQATGESGSAVPRPSCWRAASG